MVLVMIKCIEKLLELIFPSMCWGCDDKLLEGNGLCNQCWNDIKLYSSVCCSKCGKQGVNTCMGNEYQKCSYRDQSYDKLRAGSKFGGVVRKLIHNFKYNDKTELAALLVKLTNHVLIDLQDADVIIPVPIHSKKLRKRRYNQSALLAKEVAKIIGKKYCLSAMKRIKNTVNQITLKKSLRRQNVKSAFEVDKGHIDELKGKKVILIDDVVSTGYTVDECARCLKKVGVIEVYVLCIARNEV